MPLRWRILACLFLARSAMAYQFAFIGAVAPLYETRFGVGSADIGLLIGLYLMPGIAIALPGGALGSWFGAKRTVLLGLALMLLGGIVMATSPGWTLQLCGRALAGVGGVLLNVMMTKMVADWFANRELSTAMAFFVNSWPFGIAVALLSAPRFAQAGGLDTALWIVAGFVAAGFSLVALLYRDPPSLPAGTQRAMPQGTALAAVISAGLAWGLFNAALGMVFSFGPTNLVARGHDLVDASALISIVLWCIIPAGVIGGIVSDATGRPFVILAAANLVMFAMLAAFPVSNAIVPILVVIGFATGLPTGIYVSLAAKATDVSSRAMGMGVFWTIYYVLFAIAPWLAGLLIARQAGTEIAFQFAALLVLLALAASAAYQMLMRRNGGAETP